MFLPQVNIFLDGSPLFVNTLNIYHRENERFFMNNYLRHFRTVLGMATHMQDPNADDGITFTEQY